MFLLGVLETLPLRESDAFLEEDLAGGIGGLSVCFSSFIGSDVLPVPMSLLGNVLLLESEPRLEPDRFRECLGGVFMMSSFAFLMMDFWGVEGVEGALFLFGVITSFGGFFGVLRLLRLARLKKVDSLFDSDGKFLCGFITEGTGSFDFSFIGVGG